ncbi:YcgN family cysteine cluster protein [Pseudochelatococcus lubricantis]|uniref:YcgN family cysteine cluster protein n=1 Tax=Pseudochelatococcus lubricantis TaxID=1538102 RepID=UPI0035E4B4B7
MSSSDLPFWKTKKLHEMSPEEWELLCDGCGRCCLVKLEDEDTGRVYATDVSCKLLDAGTCRCSDYANRRRKVPDCIRLTPQEVARITWLPPTCGYRLIREGADLPWWHPLVSGDPETVHSAGISARGRISATEEEIAVDDLPARIVDWPMEDPAPSPSSPSVRQAVRRRRAAARHTDM